MRFVMMAWFLAVFFLALAPLQGWAALAQSTVPTEACFDDTASVYPPDPVPGDTATVRVYSCSSGDRILEIIYEEANTGYIHTLVYDVIQGYSMKEYTIILPKEPGVLKIIMDNKVLKQVYIYHDSITNQQIKEEGGGNFMVMAALVGAAFLILIFMVITVIVAAKKGGGR